jgi:hypothetical protein
MNCGPAASANTRGGCTGCIGLQHSRVAPHRKPVKPRSKGRGPRVSTHFAFSPRSTPMALISHPPHSTFYFLSNHPGSCVPSKRPRSAGSPCSQSRPAPRPQVPNASRAFIESLVANTQYTANLKTPNDWQSALSTSQAAFHGFEMDNVRRPFDDRRARCLLLLRTAPRSPTMNSRRLIRLPRLRGRGRDSARPPPPTAPCRSRDRQVSTT